MSNNGLSTSRLINVTVNLAPTGAQFANVDSLLIVGSSNVIDTVQRIRSYSSITAVATDFGTSAPEYLAASDFFNQSPQPNQLYIGRWAQAATAGLLVGGAVTPTNQLISTWNAITTGAFKVAVNGGSVTAVGPINFSGASNLNGVATLINTALTTASLTITCTWNGVNFVFASGTTGTSSSVSFLTSPASGTDISATLAGTAATAAYQAPGIAAETAVAAVTLLDTLPYQWYGLMMASTSKVTADDLAIAAYIEGTFHLYGVSTIDPNAISAVSTTDVGYQLKQLGYKRTLTQYSSADPYAVASLFGREFTVNFQGNNTVINLMYKQEPGILAENLTDTQADTLIAKRYNFYVNYNNGTAILQNGVMVGSYFIDEVHGTDALSNEIQVNVYNLLYTTPTKIPQTDAGVHQIVNVVEATCASFVSNGLLAPGTWTTSGFGTLNQGDFMPKGYYVYAQPVALQATADRAARKSPPIQVAAKLAGAVDTVNIAITVNR